jgi:hypothetical protein
MKRPKEVTDFLSTIDSIQSRFRDSVVIQQRQGGANESQDAAKSLEASVALTRYVDSQRGTF